MTERGLPSPSGCGFASMYDDQHARGCMACNHLRWSEYRAAHPGPVRRLFRRLGDRLFGTKGLPLPPVDDDPGGAIYRAET